FIDSRIPRDPQHSAARVGTGFPHRLFTTSHGPADTLGSTGPQQRRYFPFPGRMAPGFKGAWMNLACRAALMAAVVVASAVVPLSAAPQASQSSTSQQPASQQPATTPQQPSTTQ